MGAPKSIAKASSNSSKETRRSLHSQYPSHVGFISLLFLLGNAGLQVYSHVGLSAVIKSNIDPSAGTNPALGGATLPPTQPFNSNITIPAVSIDGLTQPGEIASYFGFSSDGGDTTCNARWWQSVGKYEYRRYLQNECKGLLFVGNTQCVMDYGSFVGTTECSQCWTDVVRCTVSQCTTCLNGDPTDPACRECAGEKCNPGFKECSGFDVIEARCTPLGDLPVLADPVTGLNKTSLLDTVGLLHTCESSTIAESSVSAVNATCNGGDEYAEELGVEPECGECFGRFRECLVDNGCAAACGIGLGKTGGTGDASTSYDEAACAACTTKTSLCALGLATCTRHYPISGFAGGVAPNATVAPVGEGQLNEPVVVYEITFIKSVEDAWNGEAYAIAFVVVLFSGVWPYAKNVVMFVSWFVPMRSSTRSKVLKNLTRLAKWSLVDVFAIIIILVGVRIDRQVTDDLRLLVFAESRMAIYTFCIAALWDLMQGEWMRWMHLKTIEEHSSETAAEEDELDNGQDDTETGAILSSGRGAVAPAGISGGGSIMRQVRFQNGEGGSMQCSSMGRSMCTLLMVVQVGLTIASIAMLVATFVLGGLISETGDKDNELEYSPWSIATYLISEEATELNEQAAGTAFLVAIYLLMSVIVPLFQFIGIIVFLSLPSGESKVKKAFARKLGLVIDIVGGFACLDVFLLSFFVVTVEWSSLINKAVAEQANNLCPEGDVCLTMDASVGPSLYVMCAVVVLGWAMELFFTFAFAQIFHPVEQVWVAKTIFNGTARVCNGVLTNSAAAVETSGASGGVAAPTNEVAKE